MRKQKVYMKKNVKYYTVYIRGKKHMSGLTKKEAREIVRNKRNSTYRSDKGLPYMQTQTPQMTKQTGKTNIERDKRYTAKPVGKRKSKNGRVYYETRANRSDRSRKKRL